MIYKKLKEYVPECIWLSYLGVCLAFAAAVLSVLSYYFIYLFLNEIIVSHNIDRALPMAIKIIVYMMLSSIIYFFSLWATHALGFRLETNLKKRGILHVTNASFSFFDKNESGRVRKMIDDNTVLTHMSVAHLIPDLSTALFMPILGGILAFYIDRNIGVIYVLTIFIGILLIKKMMGDQKFMEQYMQASEKMNAGAVEYVRGIHVLKIFKTNVEALKDFYKSVMGYSQLALQYSMSCRHWYVLFQVFFNSVFLAALFLFYIGGPDPVFLAKFMFYVIFNGVLFVSMMKIMYVGMYTFQANTCIEKIEELFAEMKSEKLESGDREKMNNYDIEFKNVSFAYQDHFVLEDLSFYLDEGKHYALVGASGSGKSTIAKLISGFYKLNSGAILIGGHSLNEYTEKTLANNISNVFQDVKLFKKSILENVSIGNPNATTAEVMQALSLAQCDEILQKFEQREHTLIGAKGVHLSGGEMQRIAIARAILKSAPIVIMDEASAAADPENEYELQMAFSNLMKGKTVIMIAHRLSSIKNVDEILVVDQGKIIERGSHEVLMKKDGVYKQLQEEFTCANEWRVR